MTINSLTLLSLLLVSYLSAKLLTDKDWGKNKNEN
jgi:hypothetical protein